MRQQRNRIARGNRLKQVADRTGRRDDGKIALGMPKIVGFDGHWLGPADERQVADRMASSGSTIVPIRSMWTMGLSDTRPRLRAVGSPNRSAVRACAAS